MLEADTLCTEHIYINERYALGQAMDLMRQLLHPRTLHPAKLPDCAKWACGLQKHSHSQSAQHLRYYIKGLSLATVVLDHTRALLPNSPPKFLPILPKLPIGMNFHFEAAPLPVH